MSANSSATVEGKRSRHGSTAAATGQEDIHREECWSETSEATKGRETTASQTHRWSGCFFRHRPQSIDLLWYLQRSAPVAISQSVVLLEFLPVRVPLIPLNQCNGY